MRNQHDLTQEALAELAFCSVQTIRFFESGKRRPALETAERLATILQVPVAQRANFLRQARASVVTDPPVTPRPEEGSSGAEVRPTHRLPLSTTSLIGREAEINVLQQLLLQDSSRLLTVLGVGGIGKTRLALATASALTTHFAAGAVFVALAPLQAAQQLPGAVADALGLVLQGVHDTQEQLLAHLATRHLLLVLDNFEHLLNDDNGSATRWVMELLARAPGLQLLITSRERLRLSGERIFELGGLSLPHDTVLPAQSDAVRLFLERAQQVDRDFVLNAQNQPAITRICQLMDGIPLAIELAAAWVRILSCQEIANEIQRSIDFLVLADRDMAPRHRSMRAVFDHSWSLLTPEEQHVLARLSVFRGGCRREAAQAVAEATLPLLASLIDKSLVRRVQESIGPGRYELHELVRQYAEQRLGDDPAQQRAVQERHCDFYARFVQEQGRALAGSQQAIALTHIEQELDNIRRAWMLAINRGFVHILQKMIDGLAEALYWRSRYHEGLGLLQTAMAQLEEHPQSAIEWQLALCHLRAWLASFLTQIGGMVEFEDLFSTVFHQLEQLEAQGADVRTYRAQILSEYAFFQVAFSGDLPKAERLQAQSIELYQELGDDHHLVMGMVRQSNIIQFLGRYSEAANIARSAIEIGERHGDQLTTLGAVGQLAHVLTQFGYFQEAEPYFRSALAAAETLRQPGRTALLMLNLGIVLCFDGRFEEAQEIWQRAYTIGTALGDRHTTAHASVLLGFSYLHQGDYAGTSTLAQEGIVKSEEMGYGRGAALGRILLSSTQLAEGDLAGAARSIEQSVVSYRTTAQPDELGWALAIQAYVLRAQGKQDEAQRVAAEAIPWVRKAPSYIAVYSLLPILTLLLFDQEESDLASEMTLALQQSIFVQQSTWYQAVIGAELDRLITALPTQTQALIAAQPATGEPRENDEILRQAALLFSHFPAW